MTQRLKTIWSDLETDPAGGGPGGGGGNEVPEDCQKTSHKPLSREPALGRCIMRLRHP